uniref:site-specific tyrosine recombinase XerD n=1 Tax=Pararhizobium sp. IMCC3301 TaxID=3067904 RepID=UPI0027419E49|nr:site-specific tyrosine recombinase XerD [Pararhizobium sp. IMCC3301]
MQTDPILIDFFLEMMVGERNAAENTILSYRRDLEDATTHMRAAGTTLGKAGTGDIEHYLENLSRHGLAASSIARRLSALKQFYRFLNTEALREDNPTLNVEAPKTRKPLPKSLQGFEVEQILSTASSDAHQADLAASSSDKSAPRRDTPLLAWRLYAQLEVLYATGLRVSELVALPKTAAHAKGPFIMVRGKGNKERLVPLTPQAKAAMETYLQRLTDYQAAMNRASKSQFLFPANSRTGHMTRQNFARDLKQLSHAACVKSPVSPHILRHAFASHLLQNGADLRALQTLLGHSDISTTQIYTHIQTDHLRETLETLHPLADQPSRPRPKAEK